MDLPILSLIFIATLVTNFLTLIPLALKSPQGVSVLFKNPAFPIGDFFAIPVFVTLATQYLNSQHQRWSDFLSPTFLLMTCISSSVIIFLIFIIFKPHKNIGIRLFVPHVMFSILVISLLVMVTLTLLKNDTSGSFAILVYISPSSRTF